VDLARNTNNKGFGFTFNCKSNRPTWLFGDGINKEMTERDGIVGKIGCWVHNNENMAVVSWSDKKTVNFITNQYMTKMVAAVKTEWTRGQNKQDHRWHRTIQQRGWGMWTPLTQHSHKFMQPQQTEKRKREEDKTEQHKKRKTETQRV
jgi:hypothetical protein